MMRKFCLEGVSSVLVIYLPFCSQAAIRVGKLDSNFALGACAKTKGLARSLSPATAVTFAPRISNWTRLEALVVFRAG